MIVKIHSDKLPNEGKFIRMYSFLLSRIRESKALWVGSARIGEEDVVYTQFGAAKRASI